MRVLSDADLHGLVAPQTLVATLEHGLVDFADKRVIVPERLHTDFLGGTLLTMPVVGVSALGAKIVSVVPTNVTRSLPPVSGMMLLCDGVTGVPRTIMSATALTAQRTGALGAVGLKYTTPADTDSIGIVGVGQQGCWQAIFARAVRPIQTVYYVARSDEKARAFVDAVGWQVPNVCLRRCSDVKELLTSTSAVIAATTSQSPVLPDHAALLEGKHFLSIGSFRPSMQELPDEVYRLSKQIVVDSYAAIKEAGDVINAVSRNLVIHSDVFHLADLVTGRRSIDLRKTSVFKSVGSALYDLYVARELDAAAQRTGRGCRFAQIPGLARGWGLWRIGDIVRCA